MRKPKHNSGLWAYLEQQSKLDATGDELAYIKKQWRKLYEKDYKQKKRAKSKEYIISFDHVQASKIRKAATEHGMKDTVFLKKAIDGYMNTIFVIRDKALLDRVLQTLLRYECTIEQMQSRDKGAWYKVDRSYENLERAINEMRSKIMGEFAHPPLLADEIRRAIKSNPDFIAKVKSILAEYDSQINVA